MDIARELLEIETLAVMMEEKARALKTFCQSERKKLAGVSTPASSRKGSLSEVQIQKVLARRNVKFQS